MESLGFRFFESFIDTVSALQWPLLAVFVAFIGRQIWHFRPEERLLSLLMFLYFFLVITSFWILKPLKKGLFIGYYDQTGFDLFAWHLSAAQAELIGHDGTCPSSRRLTLHDQRGLESHNGSFILVLLNAFAEPAGGVLQVLGGRQHEREGMLRGGDGGRIRSVARGHAVGRALVDVDVVVADPGSGHHL